MFNGTKSLDDLEKGIKQVLSQDRCSFSDEEKILLEECLGYLLQAKKIRDKSGYTDFRLIAKVIEILLQLFLAAEHIKEIF